MDKTSKILTNPGVSSKIRESAQSKKKLAETESKSKGIYDRFTSAAGGGNHDKALDAYAEIPRLGVPSDRSRCTIRSSRLRRESHEVKAAEEARRSGRCSEFQSHVNAILAIEPKQTRPWRPRNALQGRRGLAVPTAPLLTLAASPNAPRSRVTSRRIRVTSPRSRKSRRNLRSPRRPESPKAEKTPAVEPTGDVDTRLSEAQTEYVNGNHQKAIEMAKSVQKGSPVRAWRIIGSAACNIKDPSFRQRRLSSPRRAGAGSIWSMSASATASRTWPQFKLAEP